MIMAAAVSFELSKMTTFHVFANLGYCTVPKFRGPPNGARREDQ